MTPPNLSAEEIAELQKAGARATKHPLDLHRFDKSGGAIGWQLQFDHPKKPGEVLADGSDLFNPRCKLDYELMQLLWNKRHSLLAMASRLLEVEASRHARERATRTELLSVIAKQARHSDGQLVTAKWLAAFAPELVSGEFSKLGWPGVTSKL